MNSRRILEALEGKAGSRTHAHIIGASDSGKSKFLESLMRECYISRRGFAFVDFHGTTYDSLLRFFAYIQPSVPVILLNPSEPDFVVGFNPFSEGGDDVSTAVSRRVNAIVKAWGANDTNQTPIVETVTGLVLHTAIALKETLPNVAQLLDFENQSLIPRILPALDTPDHRVAYRKLKDLSQASYTQWRDQVGSTDRRLTRFVDPKGIRRFIGLRETISLQEVIEKKAILLVNLGQTERLSRQEAKVFASLFLAEFFEAGMRNRKRPKSYFLFLDEFQQYITRDMADMLDEVRKGGLHLVMAHQRLEHLNRDPELKDAIFTNARIKCVFGGLRTEAAIEMANELYLSETNERDILESYEHQEVESYEKQILRSEAEGQTTGSQSGAGFTEYEEGRVGVSLRHSEGSSKTESRVQGQHETLVPVYTHKVSGRKERTIEEKTRVRASFLQNLPQRKCVVKIGNSPAEEYEVPTVLDRPANVAQFVTKKNAEAKGITGEEADRLIEESRRAFLARLAPKANEVRVKRTPKLSPNTPPKL